MHIRSTIFVLRRIVGLSRHHEDVAARTVVDVEHEEPVGLSSKMARHVINTFGAVFIIGLVRQLRLHQEQLAIFLAKPRAWLVPVVLLIPSGF